jgi:hypothetical protein
MQNISLILREKQQRFFFTQVINKKNHSEKLTFLGAGLNFLEAASFIFAISLVLPVIMIGVGKISFSFFF